MNDSPIQVEMLPIEQIEVVNPRTRGQIKFKQIVASIDKLGLKKPIKVARRNGKDGHIHYDLVCGQGRLEAFRSLGQTIVPAIVVEISRKDLLLQSLVENLARRRYSAVELAKQISLLKDNGYSYEEIARKTNLTCDYVRGILRLLAKGETYLLRAVAQGQIPMTIAITIASAEDAAVQRALAEAYENKSLRGKELLKARRLIALRRAHGKTGNGILKADRPITTDRVVKAFTKEMNKQRLLVTKSKLCETRLTFAVTALKSLFKDEHFVTLLRAEGINDMPKFLQENINGR